MTIALYILAFQTILGALDNVLHHELTERLPSKPSARFELALHSAREGIYGILFLIFAWTDPQGVFAMAVMALLIAEVIITITDFVEEDRTRNLPPFERVLHTVLAVSFGLFLAFAVPNLIANASAPTVLVATSHGLLSWFFTLAAIGVLAFAVRDGIAVAALGRMTAASDAPVAASGRTVLVTGATGFIGSALVKRLLARGDRVFALARDKRHSRALLGDNVHHVDSFSALPSETRIDAVVNLAGAPILGLPWTRARRAQIWRSRIDLTNALVEWLTTLEQKPAVLVSGSAIGIYGEGNDTVLHETAAAGQGFAADLCRAWESAAQRASVLDIRVVCLRIGIVFDKSGGALPMMALPARFGLGAIFGHGRQWMSWITRDDLIRMILAGIDDKTLERRRQRRRPRTAAPRRLPAHPRAHLPPPAVLHRTRMGTEDDDGRDEHDLPFLPARRAHARNRTRLRLRCRLCRRRASPSVRPAARRASASRSAPDRETQARADRRNNAARARDACRRSRRT